MNSLKQRALALLLASLVPLFAVSAFAQPLNAPVAPIVQVEKTISLGEAFPENATARGYIFRARQLVLGPGARTELIDHAGRPSITYVTRGMVREHRTGVAEPIVHTVGAVTMDRATVTHFWENAGAEDAVLLVVEVLPQADR